MEQDIFDKIKDASVNGSVTPSDAVWDKLERRLDTETVAIPSEAKVFSFFSFKRLTIAASVLILIGAYGTLHHLGQNSVDSTAIQLEDLHTLEVNARYNAPPVGESSTIPSIQMATSINTTYKGINEGSADKKLMDRRGNSAKKTEYGLG